MATGGFDEEKKLGAGGFGSVFKGTFITHHGKLDAAIKRLNRSGRHGDGDGDGAYESENSDFMAEITTLGCMKHLNVVHLLGFCAQGPERLLVYEFVANGSLSKHIFWSSTILSWNLRFQIAVDIATGIECLHAHCPKKIVHRDIKPDNLLLDENFRAKVADFGVSQIMGPERTHITNNMFCGTPTYIAPECWCVGALATEKADAYSYGVVLLDIVSGRTVTKSGYVEDEAESEEEKGEKEEVDSSTNLTKCRLKMLPSP